MNFTEEMILKIQNNELNPHDKFAFQCSECGDCCRNRSTPIILTGVDLFRIAKEKNVRVENILANYTEWYLGTDTHLPVIVLRERSDGSCRFLRKGKCTVHVFKPVACALYPLGRAYDVQTEQFKYFVNCRCNNASYANKESTLDEWLNKFSIKETEDMTREWDKLICKLVNVTRNMDEDSVQNIIYFLFDVMYMNYDINKPYLEQVKMNMVLAEEVIKLL